MRSLLRGLFVLLALSLLALTALAAGRGGLEFSFDLSGHPAGEEVRLWLPYPVSDAGQEISDVRLSGDYAEAAVYTDRVEGTPMLYARWPKGQTSRKLVLSFTEKWEGGGRVDLSRPETAWDPADYARWLAPTSLGPTDGKVKELAEKIVAGKSTVLARARALYEWVCLNSYRNPDTRGCGQGDVCRLLNDPGGKCSDISSLYVALARAAGVPCREVFGIRLGKKEGDDLTGGYHCWAEFYLPGTGWVPVDPADVRKAMLNEKLNNEDARSAELREKFWAGLDDSRIRLSRGRDLTLAPPQAGQPLNYLMYPYAEVGGKALDWLDPKTFVYSVTYRER